MKKKQCRANIIFSNVYGMEIFFRCEKEQGHKGKHQYSGITYDSKFVLTWETLVPVKEYMPSGVILGIAQ